MTVAAQVLAATTTRSLTLPQCQADIAVLCGIANYRGIHQNQLFSKGNITRLVSGIRNQADRKTASPLTGIADLKNKVKEMLTTHGQVFLKPFSYGASHDGSFVIKLSRVEESNKRICVQTKDGTRVVQLDAFIENYVGRIQGKSFGSFWEIAVEEALQILPGTGAREIRFLVGCDPTTLQAKVYGSYGKMSDGILANGSCGGKIVPSSAIIDELSLGVELSHYLFQQCERLAISCTTMIGERIEAHIPQGTALSRVCGKGLLIPRHLCADIVIAKRKNNQVEPCLLEVTYPPGPGSDTGVQLMNPTGHKQFATDFNLMCAQDQHLIDTINQN